MAQRSVVWAEFELTLHGRSCNHCRRTFGPRTATGNLLGHLRRHHPHVLVVGPPPILPPFSQDAAEDLLSRVIAHAGLSYRLVDDSEFAKLIRYLRPDFAIPDRKKISGVLIPDLKRKIEAVLEGKLRNLDHFAITCDGWTSLANLQYVALTLHGIDKQWRLQSFLLDLLVVKNGEKAVNIKELVQESLARWGLDIGKVVCATTDAAAAMISAMQDQLGLSWIHCMAHAINLSVGRGLDRIEGLLKRVRRLSRFFRKSSKAAALLLEHQKQLGLPTLKLKMQVDTRWNSACDMIERLLGSRAAVSVALSQIQNTRKRPPSDLTTQEWNDLEGVVKVLRPIKEVTTFISGERHPTAGYIMPLYARLLRVTAAEETDARLVRKMRHRIRNDMAGRWNLLTQNVPTTVLMAVYLDPRFKTLYFVEDPTRRENLLQKAVSLVVTLSVEVGDNAVVPAGPASPALERLQGYARLLGEGLFGPPRPASQPLTIEDEMRSYHAQECFPLFEDEGSVGLSDPLVWWKTHNHRYPRLARLARQFLCIPATSVPSERVFSKTGWLVSKRRTSLSHGSVCNLSFIAMNYHHL
jgi:hypothetical protein